MTRGIFLALLAATIYGFLGISFEIAAKRRYPVWDVILFKQMTGFIIGLVCAVMLELPLYEPHLISVGLIGAVAYVITIAAYLTASRERDIAANWTIVNLSLVVPIVFSVLWFKDAFTMMKVLGIGLTLASIVLIGGRRKGKTVSHAGARWLRFMLIAFLFNGVLVVLFRFVPAKLSALFTVYFYGISFLLVLPYKFMGRTALVPERNLYLVSALGAVAHWSGIMLTIAALEVVGRISTQAGVIVYPITNGLVIPIGVLLGVWLLKQHFDLRAALGVGMGMAALGLLFLS